MTSSFPDANFSLFEDDWKSCFNRKFPDHLKETKVDFVEVPEGIVYENGIRLVCSLPVSAIIDYKDPTKIQTTVSCF